MKYTENIIGNIFTDNKIITDFNYKYISVKPISEYNYQKRSLIVGWNNVKELYPNTDILNNKLSKDLYWSFSIDEDTISYVNNVNKFILKAPHLYYNGFKYKYINILDYGKDFDIFIILKEKNIIKALIYKSFIYFLDSNNNIFGLDIRIYNQTRTLSFDIKELNSFIPEIVEIDEVEYNKIYEYYNKYGYCLRYSILMV